MSNPPLVINVKCRENDQCFYEGKDMFLDISITNNLTEEVRFPLQYAREKGPIIKLVNTRTKAETYLKTNLADFDLKEEFTAIQPKKFLTIEWVITSFELQQFGGKFVDLYAEISIMEEILIGDKKVNFSGTDTIKIVAKNPRMSS